MPGSSHARSLLVASRDWLARRALLEAAVLLSLLALAGSTWVFLEIADEVREGQYQHYDDLVLRALRSAADPAQPRGPHWLLSVARDVTALGGYTVIILITLGGVFANQACKVLSRRAAKVMNPAKDKAVFSARRARRLWAFMRWKKFSTKWRLA